jgi:bifunctional polynucleotide phosphatase/kinase
MIQEIKENNICKYIYVTNISNYNNLEKIALFDLDDTIIKFTKFEDDKFQYINDNVISKLTKLNKECHLIIISNQLNLLKNKNHRYDNWKIKIKSLFDDFTKNKLQIELYASVIDDFHRKPNPGLYNIIFDKYKIKPEFYCGDALGRQGDFYDSDLKFALNCNIQIKSPEELFLNKKRPLMKISYPKLNLKVNFKSNNNNNLITIPKEKEMIIIVGMPGSGKSHISMEIQSKGFIDRKIYMIINRDKLKTIEKCIKYCESNLKLNLNVIIDNTNPSIEDRKKFIDLAKKYSYKIRCILFDIPLEVALHNNYYRHFKYNSSLIPKIAYNIYKSKYVKP